MRSSKGSRLYRSRNIAGLALSSQKPSVTGSCEVLMSGFFLFFIMIFSSLKNGERFSYNHEIEVPLQQFGACKSCSRHNCSVTELSALLYFAALVPKFRFPSALVAQVFHVIVRFCIWYLFLVAK